MTLSTQDPYLNLPRWLLFTALGALALRLWIAVALPITGDEAFFYWWGVYPDWGYSDHPPMVGWLIWLMRTLFGEATWAIRLPIVLHSKSHQLRPALIVIRRAAGGHASESISKPICSGIFSIAPNPRL